MIDFSKIPNQRMIPSVRRYVEEHIPVGDFLTALITNNLRDTFAYADDENGAYIREWVRWFYSEAPSACWGSEEKMRAWLARDVEVAP